MPKTMELVQQLLSLGKPYFTLADLEKVLGQSRPSLYVTLNRLVSYGVLVRLRRLTLDGGAIRCHQLKDALFFGYVVDEAGPALPALRLLQSNDDRRQRRVFFGLPTSSVISGITSTCSNPLLPIETFVCTIAFRRRYDVPESHA
jgi:hypothetical protein